MTIYDASTKIAVNKAIQILEVFRLLDVDMPLGEALSFLLISQGEDKDSGGITVSDLQGRGNFSLASSSRYMRRLSTHNRKGEPGHGVVIYTEDPMDARRKILRISPKGARYLEQIKTVIEG